MVDRHPVELRAEGPSRRQPSSSRVKGLEVSSSAPVFGRDDEAEVMTVILATLREGSFVGCIGGGVEHARICAVARDALALEIGHVLGQRCRTEPGPLMADHARFHHHAPGVPERSRIETAARRPRPGRERLHCPGLSGSYCRHARELLRGPHHLADEGLWTLARRGCRAGCARAGRAGRRRGSSWRNVRRRFRAMALGALKLLVYS